MPDKNVTIDSCRVQQEDGGTLVISGWAAFTGDSPRFQVRCGNRSAAFTYNEIPRPDVEQAHPSLAGCRPGFEIRIPGMDKVIGDGADVKVRALCGTSVFRIYRTTAENIKKELGESTLKYLIEKTERRKEDIWIRGWTVSRTGQVSIAALDENGEQISDVRMEYQRRMDLSEVFHVDLSCCTGFEMLIPRSPVKGKTLTVRFSNAYSTQEYRLNLCRFDIENTRAGRAVRLLAGSDPAKNKEIIQKYGLRNFCGYVAEHSLPWGEHYDFYLKNTSASAKMLKEQSRTNLSPAPLISVIAPVDKWDDGTDRLADSLAAQSYGNWELLLAGRSRNDASLAGHLKDRRVRFLIGPGGRGRSAALEALKEAGGEYVVFAEAGSSFAPDALYRYIAVLHPHPETDVIYGDTDHRGTHYEDPLFKPEYDPDFLHSYNYIGLPLLIRKSLLLETIEDMGPGERGQAEQSYEIQMSDILLRCTERTQEIRHIPHVICHLEPEKADSGKNDLAYLKSHLERMGIAADVAETEYPGVANIKYLPSGEPKVSILIPNKDHVDDLDKCLTSVLNKSTWNNLEVIIIENNSTEPETEKYYAQAARDPRVKVVHYKGNFNYSLINNFGSAAASGEYLILLNNDTEVISPDWIENLLGYCAREGTGIAGAKLFYPDDTIQHAGIVTGIGGIAGHIDVGRAKDYAGPLMRNVSARTVSAVTGACMMIKTSVFRQIGGLDPDFAVAFNDVDFCLRAAAEGHKTVYVPGAQLYHFESKSRGLETGPEKAARFAEETALFRSRHRGFLEKGDPYYNPNLTLNGTDGSEKNVYRGEETWE